MRKYLSELRKMEFAVVVGVREGYPLSERMIELGFVAGETVLVLHEAPLSRDPIVVECSGIKLALRRDEADLVEIRDADVREGAALK